MSHISSLKYHLTLLVLTLSITAWSQHFYNVTRYGAKNDSSKLATVAIRKTIDAAAKAGGGTVYFPAGHYRTGPIHLKSNITLFIDAGAVIHFSDNFDDYQPMVPSRYEGIDVINFSPLIYAYKAENIAITGRGTIDGHGKKWWDFHHKLYDKNAPRSKWQEEFARNNKNVIRPDDATMIDRGFLRPPFIQPMFCKNVRIEGITIRNSPFWTVNPEFCENVTIEGVTIENPKSPNTDGINPESCRYVHIANCHISVGDDCITIKSGKDAAGRKMAMPAENYTITNCTMLSGHGGVVIGSEMSGGVKKIVISNCIFDGTDRGIRIKTARGRGGVVEDIRVDNIVMKNIRDQAIVLDMHYQRTSADAVSERTPQFKNIHFSNITAQTNQAVLLNGLEEMPIEDVTFSDIQFDAKKGITVREAANISFSDVCITTSEGPALTVQNVQRLEVEGVHTLKPLAGTPLITLTDTEDAFIHNCNPLAGTGVFTELKGARTRRVVLKGNNLVHVKTALDKGTEVTGEVLQHE
jgi:polygalacturonase